MRTHASRASALPRWGGHLADNRMCPEIAALHPELATPLLCSAVVTAEDFGGASVNVNVEDLYLSSNDAADTAINVFNMQLATSAQVSFFQSVTGTGWMPTNLGGIFDTEALRVADSFVTIGGFAQSTLSPEQGPGAYEGSPGTPGTNLDPNFGGNTVAHPGGLAGMCTTTRIEHGTFIALPNALHF